MAYEAEKTRLLSLIEQRTGIVRSYNADLAVLADERAYEGYLEVGIGQQPDGTYKGISHPTQTQLETRLGPEWAGKGVGEVAIWKFQVLDPMLSVIDGWMASPVHAAVLTATKYEHIGLGIYTHLPVGEPEVMRRWYVIANVSINAPTGPQPWFSDVPFDHPFYNSIEWARLNGITYGTGDGKFSPDLPVTRAQMTAFLQRIANG
jgi:hypothetical protein